MKDFRVWELTLPYQGAIKKKHSYIIAKFQPEIYCVSHPNSSFHSLVHETSSDKMLVSNHFVKDITSVQQSIGYIGQVRQLLF